VHWAKHLDVAYPVKPETFGDPSGAEAGIYSPAMRTSRAAEEMSYFRERNVAGGGNGLRLRHDDPIALAFVGAIRAGDLARSSATPSGCISDSRSVYAWWRPRRAAQPANWKMSRRFWREQAQANPGHGSPKC
jgi:hypothetical protein